MGWWSCKGGVIGDGPADLLGDALDEIVGEYQEEHGRPPTLGELAQLIEFCTRGKLKAIAAGPEEPLGKKYVPAQEVKGGPPPKKSSETWRVWEGTPFFDKPYKVEELLDKKRTLVHRIGKAVRMDVMS